MTSVFNPAVFSIAIFEPGESLLGYFVRVADRNRYETVSWVRDLASHLAQETIPSWEALLGSPKALAALGTALYPDGAQLAEHAWHPLETVGGRYIRYRMVPLPNDALRLHVAQVCPLCLAEMPCIRNEWDLSYVAICARHGIWLVDTCEKCGQSLKGLRSRVCQCSHCNADLRVALCEPASDAEVALTEDATALAPIRLAFDSRQMVVHPEALYWLTVLLARHRCAYLTNERSGLALATASVDTRRHSLRQLAHCKEGPALNCRALRQLFMERFEHIVEPFGEDAGCSRLLEALGVTDLPGPIGRFLVTGEESPATPDAAVRFNGRPPHLPSKNAVAGFLGCSEGEVQHLMNLGVITQPSFGYGFDADEILAAQSLMQELLSDEQLDVLIGFPGSSRALTNIGLLDDWPALTGSSLRFAPSTAIELWDRVCLATDVVHRTKDSVSLKEALACHQTDTYALTRIIAQIATLGVRPAGWKHPWRLADLYFDRKELQAFMQRMSITVERVVQDVTVVVPSVAKGGAKAPDRRNLESPA